MAASLAVCMMRKKEAITIVRYPLKVPGGESPLRDLHTSEVADLVVPVFTFSFNFSSVS